MLGMCFEDAEAPFQPFQAITDDLTGLSDVSIRRRAGADAAVLARIVPRLAREVGVVATPAELDAVSGQATIAAAVGRYFRRAADEAPLVLVVEDLHFATATTRATVRRIARSSTHAPILTLITTRDLHLMSMTSSGASRPRPYAGGRQHRPRRSAGRRGRRPPRPARVHRRLHDGDQRDRRQPAARRRGRPQPSRQPAPLHAMLARRYALPTEADLPVVDVASVVGTEFDLDVVARTVGCDVEAALASLASASRQPVSSTPCRVDRERLRSPTLFRRARYDSLLPQARLRSTATSPPPSRRGCRPTRKCCRNSPATLRSPRHWATRLWSTQCWPRLAPSARWGWRGGDALSPGAPGRGGDRGTATGPRPHAHHQTRRGPQRHRRPAVP